MDEKFKDFYTEETIELIKNFFNNNLDIKQTENFFTKLHDIQTKRIYPKTFRVRVLDIGKMWGYFCFINDYDFEEQTIKLNCFENYKSSNYKKALQFINYLHENSHEKQRDYYLLNNEKAIKETSDYNKLLNLEIFSYFEAKSPNYEQMLIEIDAIYNSIKKFNYLLENKILENNLENLSVLLYACVRYFASINLEKHHIYYPDNFTLKSDNLIKLYKDFYNNLNSNTCKNNMTLNEIIDSNYDICKIKKEEFKNINFDNISLELDKKTIKVFEIMEKIYLDVLTKYKPSKYILEKNKIKKDEWKKNLLNTNMVKISAYICDDLHKYFVNYQKENINYQLSL